MKGLMKVCSGGSVMWKGWRGIRLPKKSLEESMIVVVQWVGYGRYGLIP